MIYQTDYLLVGIILGQLIMLFSIYVINVLCEFQQPKQGCVY